MTFGYTKVEEEHKTLGMLTSWGGKGVTTDRLGSIRLDGNGGQYSYYPYGEVRTAPSAQTGLYADLEDPVRVYDSNGARFTRPDPLGMRSADAGNPGSWNRFAYANGDPVNFNDPSGKMPCSSGKSFDPTYCQDPIGNYPYGDNGDCLFGDEAGCYGGGGNCGGDSFLPNPDPSCYAPPPPSPAPPPPPPRTCEDVFGDPSSEEAPQLAVLLGENSWGLGYSDAAVEVEDFYMVQAMYNYAAPKGYASSPASVDRTINTDTYRGYPHGVNNLYTDLTSAAGSSLCQDLLEAEDAYGEFWNGSHSLSNVNQWRSAASHGPAGPGEIQIAGTVFFYDPGAFYSPNRPTRRPTPPIRWPRRRRP